MRTAGSQGGKDVPFPGEMLAKGKPVCTVLARGATRETCYTRLVAQTDTLKKERSMPEGKLLLITGRSTKQGTGLNRGKDSREYQEAVRTLEMNREDMARFGLREGDLVKIKTLYGEATFTCRQEKLPKGMAFVAYGSLSSRLVGGETHASGMPDAKGLEVEVVRLPEGD